MEIEERCKRTEKGMKRNVVKRSLSKRKTLLLGFARLGTPAKKRMKRFSCELTEKVEAAIKKKEIKPTERYFTFFRSSISKSVKKIYVTGFDTCCLN